MSDTEQVPEKITKPKSPGRVAAGNRLAEMNRKNKAKKSTEDPSEDSFDINPGYVIGGLGLLVAGGSLYLQWRNSKKPAVVVAPRAPTSNVPEME